MRWDESLYDALGDKLLALTTQTAIDPAVDTYYHRALGGSRTPGALWAAAGFKDTLLRWSMKQEIANGNEKAIQPGVQG